MKEALTTAFQHIQFGDKKGGVDSLIQWGSEHPTEFYKLWGRLAPTELHHNGEVTVNGVVILPAVKP